MRHGQLPTEEHQVHDILLDLAAAPNLIQRIVKYNKLNTLSLDLHALTAWQDNAATRTRHNMTKPNFQGKSSTLLSTPPKGSGNLVAVYFPIDTGMKAWKFWVWTQLMQRSRKRSPGITTNDKVSANLSRSNEALPGREKQWQDNHCHSSQTVHLQSDQSHHLYAQL